MTDKTDSKERAALREAERLLRRDAESLREGHTTHANREDWTGEEEAKVGYDEYISAADALAALAGRASLAASAGSEPVATIKSWTNGSYWRNYKVEWHRNDLPEGAQLYTHPSPPEGAGWRPVSEAPQGQLMLFCDMNASELRASFFVDWMVDGTFCGNRHHKATHCRPLPPAPPASEAKGA